ncbi:MAG TPA: class I SAM-dependent methyltransferase [Solirubrobacteraceae bacterium]|jgi:SAM-dependent methyltransferase
MSQQLLYDEIPYTSFPHSPSHPDQLATVAFLHGLNPPAVASCRVLELGCGAGANLLGMAYGLPGARLVGLDLAQGAIERARGDARTLGLSNVEFQIGDVHDMVTGGLGEFDYVIAHGLYAWIDQPAREALMAACAAHLAPDGVAYVSFNAHPGGHFRRALRELALWHARDYQDPAQRAERSRGLFASLRSLRGESDPWGALLAAELPDLSVAPTDQLVHDLLNQDWEPVWFADFAAAAQRNGLQYVGEASFHRVTGPWETDVEDELWRLAEGDRIAYQQLVDFMVWRRFRDSLLCPAGHAVTDHFDRDRLQALWFRPSGPLGEQDAQSGGILPALAAHAPQPVAFEPLRAELGTDPEHLGLSLVDLARRGRVTMHLKPPALGDAGVARPRVTGLARMQAIGGDYCTTLFGGTVRLHGSVIRTLLTLADGTRDREQIRSEIAQTSGTAVDPDQLDAALHDLAAMGLLEPT